MTCPDWNDDAPGALAAIIANIGRLWPEVETDALSRPTPATSLALAWHRRIYGGVPVPDPQYVGQVRDSDPNFPCLIDYEVEVGGMPGVPAVDVPDALRAFERGLARATATLDAVIPPNTVPVTPAAVAAVIRLCAYAHGEWIRIHPFANGNGRTARLWANWLAVRYGLPACVLVKPRPAALFYGGAAARSMLGDHGPTEVVFASMLQDAIRRASSGP